MVSNGTYIFFYSRSSLKVSSFIFCPLSFKIRTETLPSCFAPSVCYDQNLGGEGRTRDPPMQRVRHHDGEVLPGGIGLTTWSDRYVGVHCITASVSENHVCHQQPSCSYIMIRTFFYSKIVLALHRLPVVVHVEILGSGTFTFLQVFINTPLSLTFLLSNVFFKSPTSPDLLPPILFL